MSNPPSQNENTVQPIRKVQAQQIDSQTVKPEGGPMTNQLDDVQETAVESAPQKAPTIAELFGEGETAVFSVNPRITVVLTPRIPNDLPQVVAINGKHYSVHSPLKNGDGTVASPVGLIRTALAETFEYLGQLSNGNNLSFFGSADAADAAVVGVGSRIATHIDTIFHAFNDGSNEFEVPSHLLAPSTAPADAELPDALDDVAETGIDLGAEIESTVFTTDGLFSVNVWPSIGLVADDGSTAIELNVYINVLVPMLVESDKSPAIIRQIHKILTTYANKTGIDASVVRTAVVLDADSMLTPLTQLIVETFNTKGVDSLSIGYNYFENSIADDVDPVSIIPLGSSAPDAFAHVFAFGGDILLLANSFPEPEVAKPKVAAVAAPAKSSVILKKKKKKLV